MPRSEHSSFEKDNQRIQPLVQKKFGYRRRVVKQPKSIQAKQRAQSTLTQLDFVSTPRSSNEEDIDDESSDDFETPRPRKRRRRADVMDDKRHKRNTLTQMGAVRLSPLEVDEQENEVVKSYAYGGSQRSSLSGRLARDDQQHAGMRLQMVESQAESAPPKIKTESVSRRRSTAATILEISGTRDEPKIPSTPKNTGKWEAPSSETPPSIRWRLSQRTPLQERSVNIPVSLCNSKSSLKRMTMPKSSRKGKQSTSRRRRIQADTATKPNASHQPEAEAAKTPSKRPRKFRRNATVQDSQDEELDCGPETYQTLPVAGLKQVHQTQYEERAYGGMLEEGDEEQFTCDPANAALERDAARFGWTQLNQPNLRHKSQARHNERLDEDTLDDLDARVARLPNDHRQVDYSPPSTPHTSKEDLVVSIGPSKSIHHGSVHGKDDMLVIPNSQPSSTGVTSSPPVRQSQISTVIPTQSSPHYRMITSDTGRTTYTERSDDTGPHMTEVLDTESSSPLPLPPWSSPERLAWLKTADRSSKSLSKKGKSGLQDWESLADFSLPPPPPMSLGSSQSTTHR